MEINSEILEIVNAAGMTWKVRRALLRYKHGLDEEIIDFLVPRPPEGMDFHPSDY